MLGDVARWLLACRARRRYLPHGPAQEARDRPPQGRRAHHREVTWVTLWAFLLYAASRGTERKKKAA
jgi:hypothetical protein